MRLCDIKPINPTFIAERPKLVKPKVFVAMSGGVDSSVAALLLQKKGFDVTGVYMKNWSEESFGGTFAKYCPWRRDLKDVKEVCKLLRIPVKVYNFEKEYNRQVIDYFFERERAGQTPNPDVICNRTIKFGLFAQKAFTEGADFIATGHYAKKARLHGKKRAAPLYAIRAAKDKSKDQTYFLCLLKQNQIKKVLFPLGDYLKSEVRQIARQIGLPNAGKPESMGICFVGEVKLADFLRYRIKKTPGDIVTKDGRVLGRHIGFPFYTIGQRHGLKLGGGIPWYVAEKDVRRNRLIVAAGPDNPVLFKKQIYLEKINWVEGKSAGKRISALVRIRHQQKLQKAEIVMGRKLKVVFQKPQQAVAPGQFCAFYRAGRLLGGGAILTDRKTFA